jgi:uncharacterized protein
MLSATDRHTLLAIARDAIVGTVTKSACSEPVVAAGPLTEERGCFVTIKQQGALRGCIGNFLATKPLWQLVQEMATAAATHDPRFYPMKPADLEDFTLELSILSPLKKIESIDEIQVGVHGIYLEKNSARGVLLPQVATEYGWDRETFLRQTCVKAGLKPDAWQEGSSIYIFSAEIVGHE